MAVLTSCCGMLTAPRHATIHRAADMRRPQVITNFMARTSGGGAGLASGRAAPRSRVHYALRSCSRGETRALLSGLPGSPFTRSPIFEFRVIDRLQLVALEHFSMSLTRSGRHAGLVPAIRVLFV